MASSINLSDHHALEDFYITCISLQMCLIAVQGQEKDKHTNKHLVDDPDFRNNVQGLLEEHSKQFADHIQRKFKGKIFIYKRTICDQELINEFLDKKYKEYKEWEAYKESRPDLFD